MVLMVCQEGGVRQIWRILGKPEVGGNWLKQKKTNQNSAAVALGAELGCFDKASHVMGKMQGCHTETVRDCRQ